VALTSVSYRGSSRDYIGAQFAEGAEAPPLQLEAKIALGDVRGRIDHMAVDLERHRLFVARRFLRWSD